MIKKTKDQAYDASGNHIGMFDGEYLYDLQGKMVLRVDGSEVYNMDQPCKYIAHFANGVAKNFDGSVLFKIGE